VRREERGFSLIEVMVVMAIISVLMGFGIGMYRRLASVGAAEQARNTIVDTIAQVKTSSHSFPSALVVDPATQVVYGLEFRTVQNCNFEEAENSEIVGLAHKFGKFLGDGALQPFPWGHTGGAAVFERGGTINFGNYPDYDLMEGVSIDVWVYPTENMAMGILEKGDSYGLRLQRGNGGPVVEAFLRLAPPGQKKTALTRSTVQTFRVRDHPLLLNRWNRIIFSYDRTATTIAIDSFGRGAVERLRMLEADSADTAPDDESAEEMALRLSGRLIVPATDDDMLVGNEPGPLIGRIDDLKVAGILSGLHRPLPDDVVLRGGIRKIRFRDGKLDPAYHRAPETIVIEYQGVETSITIGTLGNIID
jgi:prepilin-type N-terminal cleavage/methylation domain-containing protein